MLVTIIAIVALVVLSWFFYKEIHKYKWVLFAVAAVASILLYDDSTLSTAGFLPLGFFLVVIYTGAIPKSEFKKRLNYVRSEFAITGFLLLVPHAVGFMLFFLDIGFEFTTLQSTFGTIAFMVMLPLFVTSFQKIRRMMSYKTWKRIHRFAYIIYGAIYFHLLLLQNDRFFIYLILGIVYVGLKIPQFVGYVKKRMA